MSVIIVGYGIVEDAHTGATFFHFLSDGTILSKNEFMPCGTYSIFTGPIQVLDFLQVINEEIFVELYEAWYD